MNPKSLRLYVPLFFTVFLLLFFYGRSIHSVRLAIIMVVMSLFYSLAACEATRWLTFHTRKKHPGLSNTRNRLGLMLKLGIPLAFLAAIADEAFTFLMGFFSWQSIKWVRLLWDYASMVGLSLLCSAVVTGIYEGIYYVENWKALFAESERLKKMNTTSQYQFLKDQVKPHFLFNSLNTLMSLIHADPDRAEQFAGEMSTVYRYLLTKKDKELVFLQDELNFLHAYVLMLKTRFGDSFEVHMQIEPQYLEYYLPPFALQLLVENAVKHNVVSRERPLTVYVETDPSGNLIVRNNLQPKTNPEPSEKTGLTNLIARYQLMQKQDQLWITDADGEFRVAMPLLKKSIYTSLDNSPVVA
jgi:two-component system LytT family sensor kinase